MGRCGRRASARHRTAICSAVPKGQVSFPCRPYDLQGGRNALCRCSGRRVRVTSSTTSLITTQGGGIRGIPTMLTPSAAAGGRNPASNYVPRSREDPVNPELLCAIHGAASLKNRSSPSELDVSVGSIFPLVKRPRAVRICIRAIDSHRHVRI